jgi:uncharacterized damage-inducible protein DinB
MTTREFFRARRTAEFPAFLRVFKALPKERAAYTLHERSPSAAAIVWTLTSELKACCELVETGQVDWKSTGPRELDQMIADFESHHARLDGQVATLDDVGWNRPGRFRVGTKVVMELPVGEMLWFFLFDAIHHRGQLSAYIRPMGGKVPAIYGPSGDDPGT